MLVPLAFSAYLAMGAQVPDYSVDLFLVAENKTVLRDVNWLDKPGADESVEGLLRPVLKSLAQEKTPFIVLDGGDCSIFPKTKDYFREVRYITRTYSGFDSATEGVTSRGRTKTHVLERTETEGTGMGAFQTKPLGDYRYISQGYIYFNPGNDPELYVKVQDLNSYRTASEGNHPEDRKGLDRGIILSSESIVGSRKFLRGGKYDFKGVCICLWGIADPSEPNFVSFPPAGRVAHYKLTRHDGKWGVELVEYLR